MRPPRRSYGVESMAKFKSRINELRLIIRLLRNGEISGLTAAKELDRVQVDLYVLSQTKR